ncbi:hypothetical protein [Massilioclostridium coli]|uniref:hypothetical protein n=1 Tax=Massilioclostridium coli TaxID=1870991 RepID=UPI0022E3C62F|nr:hypothetical protein [Massilioclostridium coli]
MFKKVLAVLLAGTLLVGCCTACGTSEEEKQGAYQAFQDAAKTINESSGYVFSLFGSLTTEYNDNSSMQGISSRYTTKNQDGKQLVESYLSFSTTTQEPTSTILESDGTNYCVIDESGSSSSSADGTSTGNTVQELTQEQFQQMTGYGKIGTDFKAEDIKSVSTKNDEGNTSYEITLNRKNAVNLATWLMESISYIDTEQVPVDFDVDSLVCTVTVGENGEPKSFRYELETDMTAEGETLHAEYRVSYSIEQYGDEVQLEIPDLRSYLDANVAASTDGATE